MDLAQLQILHTNDTHGRLADRAGDPTPAARRLGELLAACPDLLYLDAGDTVSAGNLGFRPGGEPALDVLSDLGCAAMCLGNRETHPRREIFPVKVGRARFPLLSANAVARGGAPLPVRPHVLLEWRGVRVGVLGVTVSMFARKQWSQPLCDYWFEDPLATACREAALLRPQVEVLVALTHIGLRADLELAAACPELDLVIGGHSHTELEEPRWVGAVPVLQARAFAGAAGLARLEVRDGRGVLTGWEKHALAPAGPPEL